MGTTVSFRANATPQEKAEAKSSAKASLAGTAIMAGGGAVAGGAIGALASFLPANPLGKVIEGLDQMGDPFAKDYFRKTKDFFEAQHTDIAPDKLQSLKESAENAYNAVKEKAVDLIKNAPESDLVKSAKKAAKSMARPNRIAKGIGYGVMIALLWNIISSFRKPKAEKQSVKTFQG